VLGASSTWAAAWRLDWDDRWIVRVEAEGGWAGGHWWTVVQGVPVFGGDHQSWCMAVLPVRHEALLLFPDGGERPSISLSS
jgi:hypothetical protein